MPRTDIIAIIVQLSDLLVPVTLVMVWVSLKAAWRAGPNGAALALPLIAATVWGSVWVWWPPLAAQRLQPPPFGQGAAILISVIGLVSLLFLKKARLFFASANLRALVALGPWRIVYGCALLAVGLSGGLPAAFFWSAALGDIAVGLWSLAIMARGDTVTLREITLWNGVGFADLVHVLALGATTLAGFYASHPAILPLNLLPLVGVPVFMAAHVMSLWGLSSAKNINAHQRNPQDKGH